MQHNATLNTIHSRKSVRHFAKGEVTKIQLKELIRAGMAAPSARNLQPWMFVVITQRDTLHLLAEKLPYAKMLIGAAAAVVVCGVPEVAVADSPPDYWVQDCSAATQNILLAAESLGIGAVWTGVFPRTERIKVVKEALGLPEHVMPLNVIPIGIPDGTDKPKDKFDPEKIRWEKWS